MSEIVNQPYLVATLVNQLGCRPDWATYPVQGIYLEPAVQAIYPASFDLGDNPLPLGADTPIGNARHSGVMLGHDKRTKTHGPHVPQFNRQAVSLVTMDEVQFIAGLLCIDRDDSLGILREPGFADEQVLEAVGKDRDVATGLVIAHCLGANMLVGGLADGQRLQVGYDVGGLGEGTNPKTQQPRPEFRGAVGVTGVNQPCPQPGALLAKAYGLGDPRGMSQLFEGGVRDRRGHVAQVIEAGVLRMGDPLFIAPYRS